MRLNAISLLALLLLMTLIGCQDNVEPPSSAFATVSPSATLPIGVSFATITPMSGKPATPLPQGKATEVPPSETPTPALAAYLVEAGDTLVGIAAAQGVTLEELLAVNPGVRPELLMVGQEIFLPPKPTSEALVPVATDAPVALEVAGLGTFNSASGGTWVLGEVTNGEQFPVELVQVVVRLKSADDELLASRELWLTPVTIPPLTSAPFGALFSDVRSTAATAEVGIVAGRRVNDLGNRYLDLAVVDAEVTIGRNPIMVSGQIENQGENPATQISLVTTFYDSEGVVTGFHELVLDETILPGERRSFDFIALPPGGRVDEYAFAFQAIVGE